MREPRPDRALRILAAALAVMTVGLGAAACATSPPPRSAEEPAPEAVPPPAAIVMLFAGSRAGEPLPSDRPNPGAAYPDPGWRLSMVRLDTGEESVIATGAEVAQTWEGGFTLSPDGTSVLFGEYAKGPAAYVPGRFDLQLIDLDTGSIAPVGIESADSWGFADGKVIATVPQDPDDSAEESTATAWSVAVVESDEGVTTTRTVNPMPSDQAEDDTSWYLSPNAGYVGGLQFLGAYDGDAYFLTLGLGGWGGFASPPQRVYRLPADSEDLVEVLEFDDLSIPFARPEPGETISHRSPLWKISSQELRLEPHISAGVLPVRRRDFTVVDPALVPEGEEIGYLGGMGGIPVEGFPPSGVTTSAVEVHRLDSSDPSEPQRSFVVTESTAPYDRFSQPVYDAGLTRWLTGEPLEGDPRPEDGMWLVEHDAATGDADPLFRAGRTARPAPMPLGYVGPDRDVVFVLPAESGYQHSLMLYDRSDLSARELMLFYGPPEGAYDEGAVLLGATRVHPE